VSVWLRRCPASLAHIQDNLRRLRLYRIHDRLEAVLEKAAKNNVSYTDFLDEILSQEVASTLEKNVVLGTGLAKFPYDKPPRFLRLRLSTFDRQEADQGTC
jgi:hypothetical protein